MNIYTIYFNTLDFPGLYVARRFEFEKATNDHFANVEYQAVVDWVVSESRKAGVDPTRIQRHANDEPQIVECWL